MKDGRGEEGDRRTYRRRQMGLGKAHRSDVANQVMKAQRFRNTAEVFEESQRIGQIPQPLGIFGRQAGGEEVLGLACLVEEREHAAPCAGQ